MQILGVLVIAFSGEGAGSVISTNVKIGYICFAGTLILLIYSYFLFHCGRLKSSWIVKFLLASFLFHPAWTLSAFSGDGGYMKVQVSYFILLLIW